MRQSCESIFAFAGINIHVCDANRVLRRCPLFRTDSPIGPAGAWSAWSLNGVWRSRRWWLSGWRTASERARELEATIRLLRELEEHRDLLRRSQRVAQIDSRRGAGTTVTVLLSIDPVESEWTGPSTADPDSTTIWRNRSPGPTYSTCCTDRRERSEIVTLVARRVVSPGDVLSGCIPISPGSAEVPIARLYTPIPVLPLCPGPVGVPVWLGCCKQSVRNAENGRLNEDGPDSGRGWFPRVCVRLIRYLVLNSVMTTNDELLIKLEASRVAADRLEQSLREAREREWEIKRELVRMRPAADERSDPGVDATSDDVRERREGLLRDLFRQREIEAATGEAARNARTVATHLSERLDARRE